VLHSTKLWLAVALALVGACSDKDQKGAPAAPVFKVKGPNAPDGSNELLVRMESAQSDRFLLAVYTMPPGSSMVPPPDDPRQNGGWPRHVYRYDPATESLEAVDTDTWYKAEGEVCIGRLRGKPPRGWVTFNEPQGALHGAFGTTIATRGKYAVKSQVNPEGDRVAVLSADGPRSRSGQMMFFGGKSYRGQHYHEVLTLPDFKPVGEPVPIPLKYKWDVIIISWSPDGRYVIYRYGSSANTCIIPVPYNRSEQP
jgi:hypothetical protein